MRGLGKIELFQQLIVRVPLEMHKAISERAKEERRTMAEVTREALRQYLASEPS